MASRPHRCRASFTAIAALACGIAAAGACGRSALDVDAADLYASGSGSGAGSGTGSGAGGPGPGGEGTGGGATGGSTSSSGGSGGGGGAASCAIATQCDDGDPCTTDDCEAGECTSEPRDDDDDGWVAEGCPGGGDCNDVNPNVHPGAAEICTDAADNDCNDVADCFDPACVEAPDCGCKPAAGGEACDNGKDDDCDTVVDCNDADCAATPLCTGCLSSETGLCDNGFDDDCDGDIDCDDANCFSDPGCTCKLDVEACDSGADEDCDLLIDCADPDCKGSYACVCPPPGSPESCGNGLDDDCDVLVDCADPECLTSVACQTCTAEVCDNGKDENCNGQIDCADAACFFHPSCAAAPEVCNNALDDDHDGLVDCQDPDCKNNPVCVLAQANCLSPKLISGSGTFTGDTTGHVSETKGACGGDAGEAVFYFVLTEAARVHLDSIGTTFDSTLYVRTGVCNTGTEIGCDDDSAGSQWAAQLDFTILYPGVYFVFLDGYTIDPELGANEGPFVLNVEIETNPPEICEDAIDNDGDIYVDCADPDCTWAGKCATCLLGGPATPELGVVACSDGVDDDCDGATDCADDDCSASDYYVTECCDGADENDNGIADDFNCRCATSADCEAGQICYAHTAHACGIPCTDYFGDVCPFVAAGAYCNASTLECEFP